MSDSFEWNEATIARLRALWAEGLSTAEIGRRMGCGKNAVVGKAHRLNLPTRPSPVRPKGVRDDGSKVLPPRVKGPTLAPLASVVAVATPVAMQAAVPEVWRALRAHPCAFPLGEPRTPTFRYCDAPVEVVGRSYCEEHHALAWVKPRMRPAYVEAANAKRASFGRLGMGMIRHEAEA